MTKSEFLLKRRSNDKTCDILHAYTSGPAPARPRPPLGAAASGPKQAGAAPCVRSVRARVALWARKGGGGREMWKEPTCFHVNDKCRAHNVNVSTPCHPCHTARSATSSAKAPTRSATKMGPASSEYEADPRRPARDGGGGGGGARGLHACSRCCPTAHIWYSWRSGSSPATSSCRSPSQAQRQRCPKKPSAQMQSPVPPSQSPCLRPASDARLPPLQSTPPHRSTSVPRAAMTVMSAVGHGGKVQISDPRSATIVQGWNSSPSGPR
jgi:hypothetical protein